MAATQLSLFPEPSGHWIYRPWITVKGRRIYASWYGKKAFRIFVED
ncbi:MAG: hypothetical protein ACM31D_17375 [Bacteroidota bacterium]